jgi:hypothetical protein
MRGMTTQFGVLFWFEDCFKGYLWMFLMLSSHIIGFVFVLHILLEHGGTYAEVPRHQSGYCCVCSWRFSDWRHYEHVADNRDRYATFGGIYSSNNDNRTRLLVRSSYYSFFCHKEKLMMQIEIRRIAGISMFYHELENIHLRKEICFHLFPSELTREWMRIIWRIFLSYGSFCSGGIQRLVGCVGRERAVWIPANSQRYHLSPQETALVGSCVHHEAKWKKDIIGSRAVRLVKEMFSKSILQAPDGPNGRWELPHALSYESGTFEQTEVVISRRNTSRYSSPAASVCL